jgi:hypothetical protein
MLGLGTGLLNASSGGAAVAVAKNASVPQTLVNDYSILVDGIDDYMFSDDNDCIFEGYSVNSFSLGFWVYLKERPAFVFWKGDYFSGSYLTVSIDATGDVHIWGANNSVQTISTRWGSDLAEDTWYHVLITSDVSGTNRVNNCYIDGVAQTQNLSTTFTSSTNIEGHTTGEIMRIGALDALVYYNFAIDHIASWNTVLPAAAAAEIGGATHVRLNINSPSGDYSHGSNLQQWYQGESTTLGFSGTHFYDINQGLSGTSVDKLYYSGAGAVGDTITGLPLSEGSLFVQS